MGSPTSDHFDDETRKKIAMLGNGALLHATDMLVDPNFANALILVCSYSSDGAYGLVLNRPSHMPLGEVFDIDEPYKKLVRKIYFGGPVSQNTLQIISRGNSLRTHALKVSDSVFLGGDWDTLSEILDSDPHDTLLFLGYAGWITSQLEIEIAEGSWDVHQCNLEEVLDNEETLLSYENAMLSTWLHTNSHVAQ